jgi:hypothetical protein
MLMELSHHIVNLEKMVRQRPNLWLLKYRELGDLSFLLTFISAFIRPISFSAPKKVIFICDEGGYSLVAEDCKLNIDGIEINKMENLFWFLEDKHLSNGSFLDIHTLLPFVFLPKTCVINLSLNYDTFSCLFSDGKYLDAPFTWLVNDNKFQLTLYYTFPAESDMGQLVPITERFSRLEYELRLLGNGSKISLLLTSTGYTIEFFPDK